MTAAVVILAIALGAAVVGMAWAHRRLRTQVAACAAADRDRAAVLTQLTRDFRDPLHAAIGLCDMLEADATPQQQAQIASIRTSVERLMIVAGNSMGYLATLPPSPVRFSLLELVEEASASARSQAMAKGLHFDIHIEPEAPDEITFDRLALRRIIVNLLDHAIALTERGHVEMTLHAAATGSISFSVCDTGPSLAPEAREGQFSAFGLDGRIPGGNPSGTGLNLCVARKLARQAGGDIQCSGKRPTEGTVYHASLPADVHTQAACSEPAKGGNVVSLADFYARHRAAVHSRSVLVVEDQPSNQQVIVSALRRGGHRPTVVGTGDAALERLAAADYDVVVVDLRLPGTSGLDVIKLSRLADPSRRVPFIVLTGEASERVQQECFDAGAWAFLTKPVSSRRLLDSVAAVCDRAEVLAGVPTAAAAEVGPLNSAIGNALVSGEPSRTLLDAMRDALRYVSETESAAAAQDWSAVVTRLRALRGTAYILSARPVLSVCRRLLELPADALQMHWRRHHRDLVQALEESRRDLTRLFDRSASR